LLPSLTPFPTPSPVATVANVILPDDAPPEPPGAVEPGSGEGLFQRLLAIDTGRLVDAFWQGARLALWPFLALAAYLVLRGTVRRLWRTLWGRWQEQRGRK
jgi:hypothetical protein